MSNRFEKAIWEAGDFQRQAAERAASEALNQYNDAMIRQHDAEVWEEINDNTSSIISNVLGFLS